METLEDFAERIDNFNSLSPADKIPFLAFYMQEIAEKKPFKSKDIESCFATLHCKAYSNIPLFLNQKAKGKGHVFVKAKDGFTLERTARETIQDSIGQTKIRKPSSKLFPLEIFKDTRGYLESIASQAITGYDYGLFDASSVMIRKLLETLIIESFERKKLEDKIKNGQGFYFYLSDLITELINEKDTFTISRNTLQSLPKLKKLGDMSAHNRRYVAKKSDIENVKDELRTTLEELVHIIDYKNWRT
jgi:hypothetical protein